MQPDEDLSLIIYGKTGRHDTEAVLAWLRAAGSTATLRRRRNQGVVWWNLMNQPGTVTVWRTSHDPRVCLRADRTAWSARWETPLHCAREAARVTGCVVEYAYQGEVWAVRPPGGAGEEVVGPATLWGSLATGRDSPVC